MVANVLHQAGVFIGSQIDDAVYEDVEISNAIESGNSPDELQEIISKRDSDHNIWGWKRPGAIKYIDKFEQYLRNPHYIIMFRDSLAISIRNKISVNTDLLRNLKATHIEYLDVIDFITSTSKPCLLVSYEKAMQKKDHFLSSLFNFLDIEATQEQIVSSKEVMKADKEKYLYSARLHKYQGVFDRIEGGNIIGWANNSASEEPVELDILVDGKKVTRVLANSYREDLEKNGIGSGKHSFVTNIEQYVEPDMKSTIRIKIAGIDFELRNSPKVIKLTTSE